MRAITLECRREASELTRKSVKKGPIGTKRVVLGSVCGFGCVLVRVWCWGI